MYIDEIFEKEIFPQLKEYLKENSIYKPEMIKRNEPESKVFPIVTAVIYESNDKYTNLSYGEETENFYMDINVYSNDVGKASKRTVCNEITNWIIKWFKDNLKVSITVRKDLQNIDTSIHRNYINIGGVLDTKYGEENYVIYPTLKDSNYYSWYRR